MKKVLLLVVASIAASLISAGSAFAATTFVRAGAFGEVLSNPSQPRPASLGRIAVDHDSGDVYVTSLLEDRVDVFRPAGNGADLLTSFGAGDLTDPSGIAIDQDTGAVYVADGDEVVKYDSDGAPTPSFSKDSGFGLAMTGPLAFDQSADELLVADRAAGLIRRYSTAGVAGATFDGSAGSGSPGAFAGLQDLAVDSTGDIVAVDSVGDPGAGAVSRVERYTSSGQWEATIGPVDQAATLGIADGDSVLVGGNQDAVNDNQLPTLRRFAPDGTDLGAVAIDGSAIYSTTTGIATDDGPTGRMFVATDISAGNYLGQYGLTSVQTYDVRQLPTVTISPTTNVAEFSATLHGTVNPEGGSTIYHFEVSPDSGSSWTTVDADGDGSEDAGDGTDPVAVSETASGLSDGIEYRYRLVADRADAIATSAYETFTTVDVDPPGVTIAPSTHVTAGSASLSGTVDPQGFATTYRFGFSTDGFSWTKVPGPDGDPDVDDDEGSTDGDLSVAATVTGLEPLTAYQVRLVATNGAGTAETGPESIATLAAPPAVTTGTAIAGETSLRPSGALDAQGSPTTYWFEYGTDTSYGTSVPVAQNANGGTGNSPVDVQRYIDGLEPDTTYHYRLVAHNAEGFAYGDDETATTLSVASAADCPNTAIRTEQHAEHLSDCKAYEMVSPPDKSGSTVLDLPMTATGISAFSADGARAIFTSFGAFADATSGMPYSYLSQRTGSGWTTRVASPPPVVAAPNVLTGDVSVWMDTDPNLTSGVTETRDRLDPADVNGNFDVYRVGAGEPELLSRGNAGTMVGTGGGGGLFAGQTANGSHTYFRTDSHLLPEDAGRVGGTDIYVRTGGETRLINLADDDSLLATCGSMLGGLSFVSGSTRNAISRAGDRVVFSVPDAVSFGSDPDCLEPTQIYQRTEDGRTLHVSGSRRSVADPGGTADASFQGASSDGRWIVFESAEMLTDDAPAGGGIYEFDTQEETLRVIVGDGTVAKVSDDAKSIAFLSASFAGPDAGPLGITSLYVYRRVSGAVERVASRVNSGSIAGNVESQRSISFTSGGDLVFINSNPLTGYDNKGFEEVYVYSQGGGLVCVSCDPAGQRGGDSVPRSNASLMRQRGGIYVDARPSFSGDGDRLIFETGDRLVPKDTNSRIDVYEFADDRVHLVSSGRSDQNSYAVGISSDGKSFLFSTYESLLPQDRDGGDQDMYVARSGGGFASPEVKASVPCAGDACQGSPPLAPSSPAVGSLTFDRSGDARERVTTGAVKVSKLRAAAGFSARLRVRVPGRGRIVVSGPALAKSSKLVPKAASYRVTVRLSSRARRTLTRKRRLDVNATVRFVPATGESRSARVRMTFKRASKAKTWAGRAPADRRSNEKGGR